QAAFEELEGYLRGDAAGGEKAALPPESLRPDFAELDLPFGAPEKECREAYRRLLKKHHPDRHAKHPENFRAATVKTARLNAAFDRIEDWRKSGS
ncbi:MAG: J domain-containing protein, partial [Treponema sp.]|nr:J domain-containing protein [Treponema sp.]